MQPFSFLSDGTSNALRLQCGHTLWSLDKLPFNSPIEWTIEEKMRLVKDAGFVHIECWIEDDERGRTVVREVELNGLMLALGHRPSTPEATLDAVRRAHKFGAKWVLCQPAIAYHSLQEVVEIVRAGSQLAAELNINYFVETHRNNFTETIRQTLELIEAVPDIAIIADFSHFAVVGEFYGWSGAGVIERMRPIIERVAHVHGCISNGELVQVDVGDGQDLSEGPPAGFFFEMWRECFSTWRKRAGQGDVMPFSTELGPPCYAITTREGLEISDRWEQSLVMRDLTERAWKAYAI
jgi:sugar phosphate isomerase/epimerase